MKNEPNNRINTIAYLVRRFILHMIIQSLVVGQSDASATAQYTRGEQKEKEGRRLKNIRLHVEDHEHLTRGPVLRGREIKATRGVDIASKFVLRDYWCYDEAKTMARMALMS